jgi:hypothetical protein
MRLMKRAYIGVSVLAVCIAFTMVDRAFTRVGDQGSNEPAVSSQKDGKYVVIGSLQTRDKIVTISRGPKGIVYTIQDKDGKIVGKRLQEKDLQAKYPGIYQQIKSGLAGNDATLRK